MISQYNEGLVCEFRDLNKSISNDSLLCSDCNKCHLISTNPIQTKAINELKIFGETLNWDLPNE